MNKLLAAALAAGALTAAAGCSSSGSTNSASSASSSAAGASSSAAGAPSGGAKSADASSSGRNLCDAVPASEVTALTGQSITSATPLSSGSHFRSSFQGPSCQYVTATGLGGVTAELVAAESYQALTTDPALKPKPMAGVGDEAFQVVDQVDGTKVIRTLAKKGDQYIFVQIFSGTTADNAKALTNKLLG